MKEHQNNPGQKTPGILHKIVEGDIDPNSIGRIVKTGGKISGILGIIAVLIIGSLFIATISSLYSKSQIPLPVALVFDFFVILMIVLKIISYRRISRVQLEPRAAGEEAITNSIEIAPDEKVADCIAGITRAGWGVHSVEVLGAGENKMPENAMLITNKQVIFIVVPVLGADKIIAGADISESQWLYSKKKIEENLREIVATVPLEQIIKSHHRNFALPLSEIKVQFGSGLFKNNISFLCGSKKYNYSLRDMKDIERTKTIFKDNIASST